MDPTDPLFSSLPAEVLLQIAKQVSSLPSFRNLDKASPTISSLFDEFGPEIVESIISTNLPAQVQSLIRTIVLIRSNLTLTQSLDEFSSTYLKRDGYCEKFPHTPKLALCIRRVHPSLDDSFKVCEGCKEAFPPIGISQDTPSGILRNILDSACQNQNLTDELLQSCLDRCLNSKPLQLGQKFHYIARPNVGRAPQRRPVGKPFTPESSGPFSWTERQRTSRHFWRVQLFFYLKLSSRDLPWTLEDLARLGSLDIFSFWELSGTYGRFNEQLGTIVDYLVNTGQQYGNDSFDQRAATQTLNQISTASSITRTTEEVPSSLDHHTLDTATQAERLVHVIKRPTHCMWGPLRYYSLGYWRRFGFYMWDDERMHSLGFLFRRTLTEDGGYHTANFSKDDMWFRWESVLSHDIIEANERRRLSEFPDDRKEFGSYKRETWWSTGEFETD